MMSELTIGEKTGHRFQLTEGLGDTRELVHVLHDHAGGGEHAHAAVLELGLAQPAHVDDAGEPKRVEADVTDLHPSDVSSSDTSLRAPLKTRLSNRL
eukprot:830395-Rhodomonas_salina.1